MLSLAGDNHGYDPGVVDHRLVDVAGKRGDFVAGLRTLAAALAWRIPSALGLRFDCRRRRCWHMAPATNCSSLSGPALIPGVGVAPNAKCQADAQMPEKRLTSHRPRKDEVRRSAVRFSKSLTRRRFRLSHEKVRLTTERRGNTTTTFMSWDRLPISTGRPRNFGGRAPDSQ